MQSLQEIEAERGLLIIIVFLSLGSLFVAFLGQHVFDIRPCILCICQRIPYVVTTLIAGAAAAPPISSGSRRLAVALCGVVFAAGAALAAYSVGVEEHWWAGAAGCEGTVVTIFSLDALRGESAMASPLRTCDLDVWRLFGLSLAAYNAMVQIVVAAACLIGLPWITRHRLGSAHMKWRLPLVGVVVTALLPFPSAIAADGAPTGPASGNSPDWYYPEWLATAPHTPVFRVRDTVNKYGRYAGDTKAITLKDLIKHHGHFCGGLVEGAMTLQVAFSRLFADGVIDRTDLRVASNNSACGADVADYLTGARTRFGSHLLDRTLGASEYVVGRLSTKNSVRVSINQQTYPVEVRALMKTIESGAYEPADVDRFQELQWQYARVLVSRPAIAAVDIQDATTYQWPEPPCGDFGRRTDNDYKSVPVTSPERR